MVGLLERLADGAVLVSDGAMGTQLFSRGLKPGESPEALNLSHPEYLQEIAREYREAGADIVHTNTFGGSPVSLAGFGLADRTEEINTRAVEAARRFWHRSRVLWQAASPEPAWPRDTRAPPGTSQARSSASWYGLHQA